MDRPVACLTDVEMARKLPIRNSWSDGGTRAVVMEAVEPCHEGWSCAVLARLGEWPWIVMAGEVRPADSPCAASRRGRGYQDDPPCECSGKAPWLEDRISPMGREVSVMRYRPSQARYTGGGQVKYLVYRSPQPLRTGHVQ